MEVHLSDGLPIKGEESRMHVYEGLVTKYDIEGPRFWKLTMHVRGMCRLVLGTLARVGKQLS